MALERSSHGYGQCTYHIVLVPRYRHRVFLDARIKKRCEELLMEKAIREGFLIYGLQVAPDHVHLFLGIGPTRSVSEAIRLLKCNTARELFSVEEELQARALLVQWQVLPFDWPGDRGDHPALHASPGRATSSQRIPHAQQ